MKKTAESARNLIHILFQRVQKTMCCYIPTWYIYFLIKQIFIGIGFETAKEFAKRGARVILACRNQEKGIKALSKIVLETGNQNVVLKLVNLASLDSVAQLANDINRNESRLDILVNNAGVGRAIPRLTKDGLDLTLQINYFSSFLLTNLLLGKLDLCCFNFTLFNRQTY